MTKGTRQTIERNSVSYPGFVKFGVYGNGKFLVGCPDSRTAGRIMERLVLDVKSGRSSWKNIEIRQIAGIKKQGVA